MKNLAKRMVAISAALILLCVTAVAQNEKSTRSVTSDSEHGVIVAPNYVRLKPGHEKCVTIVLNPGYINPVLIYDGERFDINNRIIYGSCFKAEIISISNGGGVICITADYDVNTKVTDEFYVKAMVDYGDNTWSTRTTPDYGVIIHVEVDPDLIE